MSRTTDNPLYSSAPGQNGKGRGPEKGVNLPKFREGYDGINWGKKPVKPAKKKV